MIMLGGINVFFGPLVGAALLLVLNDFVTMVTEHYSLVLGVIILLRPRSAQGCWGSCYRHGRHRIRGAQIIRQRRAVRAATAYAQDREPAEVVRRCQRDQRCRWISRPVR